jgi:hypothetical protein
MNCSIVTTDRKFTAVIQAAAPFAGLPETQRVARAALAATLPSLDVGPLGRTCTRWTPPVNGVLAMEIGMIVSKPFAASGDVVASELPAGRAVHLSMNCSFEHLPEAWKKLFDWCKAKGLTPAGVNWEIYGATEGAELYALLSSGL